MYFAHANDLCTFCVYAVDDSGMTAAPILLLSYVESSQCFIFAGILHRNIGRQLYRWGGNILLAHMQRQRGQVVNTTIGCTHRMVHLSFAPCSLSSPYVRLPKLIKLIFTQTQQKQLITCATFFG